MRLLLDAHLSPVIARRLRNDGIDAVAVRDWLGGNYRTASDDQLLTAGVADERVLVTYDCRTIPTLLREWAESGQPRAGVVLIDNRTLRSGDIGGLLRALRLLIHERDSEDWHNRVVFLQASRRHA